MAETVNVHPYDALSRDRQMQAFYVDLRLGGPSRIIPSIPTQRQIAEVRGDAHAAIPTADPAELYAQAILEQSSPFVDTEAGRLLGFAAIEGSPN